MKKVTIIGMQTPECAAIVEEGLCRIDTVEDVHVSLDRQCAEVIGAVTDDQIINAVRNMGFGVKEIE
jgi:copper chaperone CopZ